MKFDTKLTPQEEKKFQQWKSIYAPHDSGEDYDLRGAYKAGLKPDPESGHWPDTFKKPNHPTFSDQSIYAEDAPEKAGHWNGETYMPPRRGMLSDFTGKDALSALGFGLLNMMHGEPFSISQTLGMANNLSNNIAPFLSGLTGENYDNYTPQSQSLMGKMHIPTGSANSMLSRLMNAIGRLESQNNYGVLGPRTRSGDRTFGRYQVMGSNIPAWTKEATGRSMTPAEFLANPEIQDMVARAKLGSYLNQYGNINDAASMWFSGHPYRGNTRRDIIGTSVPEYVNTVNRYF